MEPCMMDLNPVLRKIGREYDLTERAEILCKLEEATR